MARLTRVDVALFFGVFGLACTVIVVTAVAGSSANWPLFALPVLALAAMFVRSAKVRLAAALGMCAWCVLAAASVGMFLVPAAVTMFWAARGTQ
jgi:hypothetical protein